jgi:hypothetical protein
VYECVAAGLSLFHCLCVVLQVSVELIEWRSLQLGRRIGRGAEGCVYEARHQDAPVAIKESPGMNEIEMYLAAGVHDNLVGLRGLCHKVSCLQAGTLYSACLDWMKSKTLAATGAARCGAL